MDEVPPIGELSAEWVILLVGGALLLLGICWLIYYLSKVSNRFPASRRRRRARQHYQEHQRQAASGKRLSIYEAELLAEQKTTDPAPSDPRE